MTVLHNSELEITVSPLGAELKSIRSRNNGFEFLWPGIEIWNRSAPVLFPIVGKLKDNKLKIAGKGYAMSQHGFARDREFQLLEESATDCTYILEVRPDEQFPYSLDFFISYELEGNRLRTCYQVDNVGKEKSWFSIGAHPAFCLPEQDLGKYFIEFEYAEPLERHLLQEGLFSGEKENLPLQKNRLSLSAALLKQDALVFKHLRSEKLWLKHQEGSFCVGLDFAGFPFLGIWTKPGTEQFLCLEPWCGLADSVFGHPSIEQKEGIVGLESGECFERSFNLILTR